MNGMEVFFIIYFGIMAACIVNQFVLRQNVAAEFLCKAAGGMAAASAALILFGHRGLALQEAWLLPMIGAFAGALVTAMIWKALPARAVVSSIHVKVKPAL